MTNEQIDNFLTPDMFTKVVNISFKTRNSLRGMFINGNDYADLKSKNFWRFISESKLDAWKKTKDMGLARMYNGSEFTKLTVTKDVPVAS